MGRAGLSVGVRWSVLVACASPRLHAGSSARTFGTCARCAEARARRELARERSRGIMLSAAAVFNRGEREKERG